MHPGLKYYIVGKNKFQNLPFPIRGLILASITIPDKILYIFSHSIPLNPYLIKYM